MRRYLVSDLPNLPHYSEPKSSRHRGRILLLMFLVAAVAVAGWFVLKPSQPAAPPDPTVAARSLLEDAMVTARSYYEQNDTMLGFSATRAHRSDPSITFNRSEEASVGQVSIRDVGPSTVVLVTLDPEGTAWCAAHTLLGDSLGRGDVATAAQCQGGW